jgi:hypothetical protein
MFLQQGDVLIKKVNSIPAGTKLPHLILAQGEATGHCHTITEGEAEIIEIGERWYLRVLSEEAILTHQEHRQIIIPQGEYEIGIVQEYDHFAEEARKVRD